jgi:hypothetical protein
VFATRSATGATHHRVSPTRTSLQDIANAVAEGEA